MKDNLPIVLGVVIAVVVAVILYFVFAKKKELPEGEAKAKDEKKPEAKPAAAKAEAKAAKEAAPKPVKGAEALPSAEVPEEARPDVGAAAEAARAVSKKDVAGLRKGLAATRGGFMARLKALFTGKKEIDPAILEQMEEVMLSSDVGVKTTQSILDRIREGLKKNELADEDAVWAALRAEATRILSIPAPKPTKAKPMVMLMVGVNGVGKTTTIGKLATKWNADGKK